MNHAGLEKLKLQAKKAIYATLSKTIALIAIVAF